MTPDEVVTELRKLRYSPVRGRRLGLAYIASRAGLSAPTLYEAINTGALADKFAKAIETVLQHVKIDVSHNASASPISAMFGKPEPQPGTHVGRRRAR